MILKKINYQALGILITSLIFLGFLIYNKIYLQETIIFQEIPSTKLQEIIIN